MSKTISVVLITIQETSKKLHTVGVIDQVTMREFGRLHLTSVEPLQPEQIKQIREDSRFSQAVFAALLMITSLLTVQKWEIS